MKYMTFNSSCSYAGVANMLALYGMDTEDRAIALGMKLPYLFTREGDEYLAGPMLQSARWFDLYLNPLGFRMTERPLPVEQVPAYLKGQKTAMLGLRVEGEGKHAVVYVGHEGGKLLFLNNKWAHDPAPERLALTEAELTHRAGPTVMVATLEQIEPKETDLAGRMEESIPVIRQNLSDIGALCHSPQTAGTLRSKLDPLFRPLLLDGITMLDLLGETDLARRFSALQRGFLAALRQSPDTPVTLDEHLPITDLTAAAEKYIKLIESELTQYKTGGC